MGTVCIKIGYNQGFCESYTNIVPRSMHTFCLKFYLLKDEQSTAILLRINIFLSLNGKRKCSKCKTKLREIFKENVILF